MNIFMSQGRKIRSSSEENQNFSHASCGGHRKVRVENENIFTTIMENCRGKFKVRLKMKKQKKNRRIN